MNISIIKESKILNIFTYIYIIRYLFKYNKIINKKHLKILNNYLK